MKRYLKVIGILVLFFLGLHIVSFLLYPHVNIFAMIQRPFDPQSSEWVCKNNHGQWKNSGYPFSYEYFCYFPTSDEGKSCYQNADCEEDCVVLSNNDGTPARDSEGFLNGICTRYSIISCSPTIPVKTKDKSMLQRGACV